MEEKELVDHILLRQNSLAKEKKPVEGELEAIAQYLLPRLEFMFNPEEKGGSRIGRKIYNGMPVNAGRLLADGLFGNMVSPNLRWLKLCMRNRELEEYPEVNKWLQECEEQLYYALRSGFYGAVHEFFEVCSKFGTAFMYIEEDVGKGSIVFDTRELSEIYIAENRYREVDTLHRKFKIAAREAVKKFPEEKLSDVLVRDSKSKDQKDAQYEFLHVIYPNEDKVYGRVDAKSKEFWSGYMQLDGKKKILLESGYDKFPGTVWRWRKRKIPWGIGPGHDVLVDAHVLNQIRKDETKGIHLAVDPALQAPAEMERIRITPHGISRYTDDKKLIKPVHVPANFQASFELEDRIEECIKDHFMVKIFLILAQQERQRTATEIMELAGEKATVWGAVIGSLEDEGLEPAIDRTFTIEANAGRMPEPPPMLYGEEMEIDYMGPLAQAQKKLLESQTIQQGLAMSQLMWEYFPETKDIVNADETERGILKGVNWPHKGFNSEDEVKEIRRIRHEQAEKERAMEQAERLADVAPKISKKVEAGSIMEKMGAGT